MKLTTAPYDVAKFVRFKRKTRQPESVSRVRRLKPARNNMKSLWRSMGPITLFLSGAKYRYTEKNRVRYFRDAFKAEFRESQ